MKIIEVLKFNRELIKTVKRLQTSGIRLDDVGYIDLYVEYKDMLEQGEKVSYIVALLANKYEVSERKVYDLIKRFNSDCKPVAV